MIWYYPDFFYFQLVAVRTAHGAKTEAVAARMAAASAGLATLAAPAPSTPTPSPRRDRLPPPGRARSTKFSSFRNIWKTTHSRYLQSRYLQKKWTKKICCCFFRNLLSILYILMAFQKWAKRWSYQFQILIKHFIKVNKKWLKEQSD